ncbi:hypothetical protein V5O48_018789 [Marasmius crinis-equi]|uniref:Uncharacterized protein n=1 Tax=Marasmius crinis-equi TaxID=585013 RepID=A0ABR3EK80_9AGAR
MTTTRTTLLLRYNSTLAQARRNSRTRQRSQVLDNEAGDPAETLRQAALQHQNNSSWDPWSAHSPSLDVMIPYKTAPWSGSRFESVSARLQQIWKNRLNGAKNSFNKLLMYYYNSFPGVDLETIRGLNYLVQVPRQLLSGTQSASKPSSWLSTLRNEIFNSYCEAQKAIANKDRAALLPYAQSEYLAETTRLLRKQAPTLRYIWNLHAAGPASSTEHKTTILSIRAFEGHLGSRPPADGNRLAIQVLAKIETLQSLETYDNSGKPLHAPSPTVTTDTHQRPVINSSLPQKVRLRRVPATAHAQTEYLIFEKKMYLTGHEWSIRERIYPREGAVVAA